jgi:hypothetical protein
MTTPPYFEHYPTFAAVPWALVLAVLVSRVPEVRRRWWPAKPRPVAAMAVSAAFVALWAPTLEMELGTPFPGPQLGTAVHDRPCVVSDVPSALAAMDVLSRDLHRGCPPIVDVLGPSYDRYAMEGPGELTVQRARDARWQRYLSTFVPSGSAMVVLDPTVTGISQATMRRLNRQPMLAEVGGYELRRGTGATAPN